MLDFLRDPIWQFVGALLAFLGILVMVYLAFLRKVKKPTFVTSDTLLQTAAHPEITIQFRGRTIANLNRLYLLFWNSGNEEIRTTDIPSTGGPCIEFREGAEVLSYAVKASSSEGINFTVAQESDRLLRVKFEYLNPGDGGVVEILYEAAEPKKPAPLKLEAAIIGAPPPRVVKYSKPFSIWITFVLSLVSVCLIAGGGLVIFGPATYRIVAVLSGSFFCALGMLFLWAVIQDRITNVTPDFAKPYFQ